MGRMENTAKRILFVLAHPGDETVWVGGTIADAVAQGAQVTVVTVTRGEHAPVLPEELRYLASDPAALAAARESELAQALACLGVTDHRWLGGLRAKPADVPLHRYADAAPASATPTTESAATTPLTEADPEAVAADVQAVVQQLRPHAIVTLGAVDADPDHAAVRRATARAFAEAHRDDEAWHPRTLFAVERPRGPLRHDLRRLARSRSVVRPRPHDRHTTIPDRRVDTSVDVRARRETIRRALQCHRTRIALEGDVWTLADGTGAPVQGYEYLVEIGGRARPVSPDAERDLINGWEPLAAREGDLHRHPVDEMPSGRGILLLERAGTAIALVLLGMLVATITTFSHAAVWRPTGQADPAIPWGLVVSFIALVGVALALRLEPAPPWSAAWYALGVWAALYTLAQASSSQALMTVPLGAIWLYGGMLAVAVVAFIPLHRSGGGR